MKDNNVLDPLPLCPVCRMQVVVDRDSNLNDILYFDGRYYHKQCFISSKSDIRRTCPVCKKINNINKDNLGEFVFYDSKFQHSNCFLKWCNETKTPKRKNALANYDIYFDFCKEKFDDILGEKKITDEYISKYHRDAIKARDDWFNGKALLDFLQDNFGFKDRSGVWRNVIMPIVNGTHRKYTTPIPAEDLLDMFKQKINYLNKANIPLKQKNPNIDTIQLLKYDIAIIANKYDSYLEWKEKQKVNEVKKLEENKNTFIKMTKFVKPIPKKKEEDISSIAEDIFS